MKKLITLLTVFFSVLTISAQAPNKMSYQAIIRNASNALVSNSNIGMKVSVLQTTANGIVVFSEYQTPTTNANGLVTIEIGGGTLLIGNFSTITWANGPYFIKTETDPTGPGTNYTISGTSQLLSVPYALYAATSGSSITNFTKTGTNIANTNTGNVGIGTAATAPAEKLEVVGKTKTTNLQVTNGAVLGTVLTSDALGNANWQDLITPFIHFSSYSGSSQAISDNPAGTVINSWSGLEETGGANYNITTGEYTIPITGYYSIMAQVSFLNANSRNGVQAYVAINVDNVGFKYGYTNDATVAEDYSDASTKLEIKLDAGQKVKIKAFQDGRTTNFLSAPATNFTVNLLHK